MNHRYSRLNQFVLILFLGLSISCSEEKKENNSSPDLNNSILLKAKEETDTICLVIDSLELDNISPVCEWEDYLESQGFIDIKSVNHKIRVELKYSTTDNFMNKDVYGCLEVCYLQPDIAERLSVCQNKLSEIDSTLSLVIYDGLRPRIVQQYMWDILDMPINEKTKFVSNPKNGSLHNFGAAVDLSIYDNSNQCTLDMGTPYDYIGVLAWPTKESQMLKDSLLSREQVDNRILLRKVMKEGKFFNIQTEWWHFNACNRNKAKELYKIIEGDTNFLPSL